MTHVVLNADCIEAMQKMEPDTIDAVVTDPPYDLTQNKKGGTGAASLNPNSPAGRSRIGTGNGGGFMGKDWDATGIAFKVETWSEVLRVAKPGAFLLAFGGSRTFHRMMIAIEDAGWELRDTIMYVYGTGFPKSLDVSKAFDKAGGVPPETQAFLLREKRENAGLTREQLAMHIGCTPSSIRDWEEGRARKSGLPVEYMVPTPEYRAKLAEVLGYTQDERKIVGLASTRVDDGSVIGLGHSGQLRDSGNTELSKQWEGWGTALKPAFEPIVVARKPLVGTVIQNVARYGTGAINIDACRVGVSSEDLSQMQGRSGASTPNQVWGEGCGRGPGGVLEGWEPKPTGRWPANLIHDDSEEVLAGFPDSKGQAGAITWQEPSNKTSTVYGDYASRMESTPRGDSGSAARFFYCAKASKSDRGVGNIHPTVKPLALMRYLVRLVTPPGGIVLDPFTGSGTTGVAAKAEGFNFLGMEREPEYHRIATARITGEVDEGVDPVVAKERDETDLLDLALSGE
jgi:site-specific DNA-methyltransferase (adenine-specific)